MVIVLLVLVYTASLLSLDVCLLVDVGDVKAVVTERQKRRGLRSAAPGISESRAATKVCEAD